MTEISREYAEALFEIACEENARDEYAEHLRNILEVFNENPEYMEFLICPGIYDAHAHPGQIAFNSL